MNLFHHSKHLKISFIRIKGSQINTIIIRLLNKNVDERMLVNVTTQNVKGIVIKSLVFVTKKGKKR